MTVIIAGTSQINNGMFIQDFCTGVMTSVTIVQLGPESFKTGQKLNFYN